MKRLAVIILVMAGFLSASPCFAAQNAPESIAGITIGNNVSSIRSLLDMDSAAAPWQEEYIKRIKIRDMEGYNGGYVVTGNCNRMDIILRMKLKYADSSLDFLTSFTPNLKKDSANPMTGEVIPSGLSKSGNGRLKTVKVTSVLLCSTSAAMMTASLKVIQSDCLVRDGSKKKQSAGM